MTDDPTRAGDHESVAEVDADAILSRLAHPVVITDAGGTIIRWNDGAEALLGWQAHEVVGRSIIDLISTEDRQRAEEVLEARIRGDVDQRAWVMNASGGESKHVVIETRPVYAADGGLVALVGALTDVDRIAALEESTLELSRRLRQALLDTMEAVAHERLHRERLEFLGRLNEMLAETSSREDVMAGVTKLAVPRLGDWCAIYVLPDPEAPVETQDLEVRVTVHDDGAEGAAVLPVEITTGHFDPEAHAWAVIRSGATEFLPEGESHEDDGAGPKIMVARSAITVPLMKRGRMLGAIQLVRAASDRPYLELDVALAEAAAARVAASLEYLRLSEHRLELARTLQSGLLPQAIPKFEGLDIAGRYQSASDGLDVGGDFYDVFELAGGSLAVTVGDVLGKGATAATVTALARDSIRMSAWHGDAPCDVLMWLNRALISTDQAVSCTAAYGVIEPTAGGFTFEISSGGHPLPILVRADHSIERPGQHGTLLGVFPDAECSAERIELGPDDALVLFTDGITDVPPPHELSDESLEAMASTAHAASIDADGLADHLLDEIDQILSMAKRRDDIAVLVIRARPAAG